MSETPYRAPMPVEPDPYLTAWESLRKPRHWAIVLGILAFIVGSMFFVIGMAGEPRSLAKAGLGLVLSVRGTFFFMQAGHRTFRCPRCRMPFFIARRGAQNDGPDDCCRRCGLKIGTPKSAEDGPA